MVFYKALSKIKKIWVTSCCLCCIVLVKSQTIESINAVFPNQDAVFLYYNQTLKLSIKDGEVVAESKHEREIMILTEKNATAFSRSKVFHSSYGSLKNLEAYTKIPNGNKFKIEKIGEQKTTSSTSDNVFYDDVKETSFDYPGLVPNAIQHLEYSLYHKDAHLISPFHLPSYLPVMNATYTVIVPNDIAIKYLVKNDAAGLFKFSEEKKKKETIYTWQLTNYREYDAYGNAPDNEYYAPHVIIYVASFQNNNTTQNYLSSVDDLFKWNVAFTKNLNNTKDATLQKIVDSLIKDKKTETDKAKNIYKWVQQNIKYVAFEDGVEGFKPRQAADICTKRYGDCKDMSSIITQMLRLANIKAYYTWIGTRNLPYKYSEIPLPIVDNHMISVAIIDNKWIFLDGTDPHALFDMPPSSIQTKEALVAISDTEYKILTVPTTPANQSFIIDTTSIYITNNGIKGTEKVNYFGYHGESIYNALLYRDDKETKDFVKSKMGKASNKFILGNYTINPFAPQQNAINISADFEIPGYGKKLGNEYYINLNLEKLFENSLIDTLKRKVAVENEFKYIIKQYHILQVPEGYKISYQPKDFFFDNELLSIKIIYTQKDDKIIAYQEFENKQLLISPLQFIEWNKAAKAVTLPYKEQVVLEKN